MKALLLPIALLLFGAWMLWSGLDDISLARRHTGYGIVSYESAAKVVSESAYKRQRYTMAGLGLAFGLLSAALGLVMLHAHSKQRQH